MVDESRQVDVAVVGAGPGGLGAAGLLTRGGFRTVLLERGLDIAWKWRNSYDRLRINTSTLTSHLPGMRFPAGNRLMADPGCAGVLLRQIRRPLRHPGVDRD